MGYKSLRSCLIDLEKKGELIRIKSEIDPYLEIAEVQRRLYDCQGPAVLFENVKGSPFPAVCNVFGTLDRTRYIFRHTLEAVKAVVNIKADPAELIKNPVNLLRAPLTALKALPLPSMNPPILYGKTTLTHLPQITSWPKDGGPYITLPQVYTEDLASPGLFSSNVGMYRVQLAGNEFLSDKEVGMHYQIHRGIGVHHSTAIKQNKKLRVSIFIGGPPAHTLAAVMPLPEGLAEVLFAGMLAGRNFRYARRNGHLLSADADFCIVGTIDPELTKPEGPFGDHLGYYSLTHPFPFMDVEEVYFRKGAVWPFTVVGRPPQEDTTFGALIHEITQPMVPVSIPGLHAMHAVDAAGVHPLLLAIGSERYVPYEGEERIPRELLTVANAVLGFGQASLAKYLMILAFEDVPELDIHHVDNFFKELLSRIDWRRDLHFQTNTTMDTLDYSGIGLNQGSKVVLAAAGPVKRSLKKELPAELYLTEQFSNPKWVFPGVIAVEGRKFETQQQAEKNISNWVNIVEHQTDWDGIMLIVITDDSDFLAHSFNNFLWVTFTRSNPSHDIYGIGSFVSFKHWGCRGPLIIDARMKPHHAPPLIEDPDILKKVDQLASPGKPLHNII